MHRYALCWKAHPFITPRASFRDTYSGWFVAAPCCVIEAANSQLTSTNFIERTPSGHVRSPEGDCWAQSSLLVKRVQFPPSRITCNDVYPPSNVLITDVNAWDPLKHLLEYLIKQVTPTWLRVPGSFQQVGTENNGITSICRRLAQLIHVLTLLIPPLAMKTKQEYGKLVFVTIT